MSPELQISLITAVSALLGSIVGGALSFLSSHYTAKKQFQREFTLREFEKHEALYSEFMTETGRLVLLRLDKKSDSALQYASLFSLLGRIRLVAPKDISDAAKAFSTLVMETSADRQQEEIHDHTVQVGAARERFTSLCQEHLRRIRANA